MTKVMKIAAVSAILFGGVGYASYQYNHIKQFEEEVYKNSKQKRAFMFNIHQKLAFRFDEMLDNYEKYSKISQYRKILCSYADGLVLETGVGTSRNIDYYPATSRIIGIDWASNLLEVAFGKSSGNQVQIEYKLDDAEKLSFKDNVFDNAVDTFGMEYYVNPEKALNELQRVVKKDGRIMILASGAGHYDLLNLYQNFKTPYTVCNRGYFPNRQWDEIITDKQFTIEKKERLLSGTLYMYILINDKK